MKYITLIILLFFLTANAQNEYHSEGFEVTKPDIEQKNFAKDSTANALIIYEYGNSYVDKSSYKLNTEVKRKIKILNRNGFERAEISIFLYDDKKGGKEKIKDINATVYNIKNGEVITTKLEKSAIFEEQYNDKYKLVKFAFPSIKEGSVINYSYTLESPFMFKYKGWNFQDDIPVLYSEYNASIPANWEYNIKLVGGQKLTTNYSGVKKNCLQGGGGANANCGVYKYVMKNIPAFIEEGYMTTKDNYLARIEYELKVFRGFNGSIDNITKTWKSTDNEIEKDTDLGIQLRKTKTVKNTIDHDFNIESDDLKKAQNIFKYVQENFVWNEKFRVLENISIKNLIKEKSGNVGEINAFLHNLLIAYDIDAKPILLSTRRNGFATKIYPVLSDFNYLIVKVDIGGKTYLLDATDDYLTFGQIPFRCLNQYGRLLDFDKGSQWYDIDIKDFSLAEYSYTLDFDANQQLKGNVNYKTTGYNALIDRKNYFNNTAAYIDRIKSRYASVDISDSKIINTDKKSSDFYFNFKVETTPDIVGNTVYLNPFLFHFFAENPFKLQERTYPIDFGYKDVFIHKIKVNIDESYQINEIPESFNLKLPENKGSLFVSTQQNGNSVTLYLKLSFNESIYDSIYYDALKTIMTKVIDTQNNALIVLEKKQ
ncbi:DUF3857 domain-containing protein [uncultured Psychroserpens sp.]|uniref:DUF3857 domain-containing protein n=1 Tax=uncultured Psychroserpens sp. TaxID=255436 RepID=UPI00260785AF|nr:DUF3857 domain-containing protein [uncultured Psychroserpens sp.]